MTRIHRSITTKKLYIIPLILVVSGELQEHVDTLFVNIYKELLVWGKTWLQVVYPQQVSEQVPEQDTEQVRGED